MERSRRALIALIALSAAGCFSDRGVAIEVDVGKTGATSVELYVGNSRCSDHKDAKIHCDGGIAPPMVQTHLAGTVWFRDDEAPFRAPVVDGKATFRLEATADTRLPIVIAVGSGGDPATTVATATLTDVVVPANTARLITTKLVVAGAIQPSSDASGDRVQVWSEPAPGVRTCVVVEHSANGEVTRDFIVPASDPDCDSEKPECDPAAAHGEIQMDGIDRAADCYSGDADEVCQLGALGCVDGSPPSGTCYTTLEQVCVPKSLCDCRGPTPSDACPLGKIGDPMAENVPHITCVIPALLPDCKVANSERIDLLQHLGNDNCEQPEMSSFELASLDNHGRSHAFNGVDLELTSPNKECGFTVQYNSGVHSKPGPELGMVRLETHQHVVLLPIIFLFADAPICPQGGVQIECHFTEAPQDPMWSCVP